MSFGILALILALSTFLTTRFYNCFTVVTQSYLPKYLCNSLRTGDLSRFAYAVSVCFWDSKSPRSVQQYAIDRFRLFRMSVWEKVRSSRNRLFSGEICIDTFIEMKMKDFSLKFSSKKFFSVYAATSNRTMFWIVEAYPGTSRSWSGWWVLLSNKRGLLWCPTDRLKTGFSSRKNRFPSQLSENPVFGHPSGFLSSI